MLSLHEGNMLHRMVMMALGQQRFRGGEKILANFEITAVHASHMLKGNWDLPESIEEMIPHQEWQYHLHGISGQIDYGHHYITLYMWKDDVKRDRLIDFWQGTDGNKPYTICVIEHLLWQAVFDIADRGGQHMQMGVEGIKPIVAIFITDSSDIPTTPLHTPGSLMTAEVVALAAPTAAKINSSSRDFRGTGSEITGKPGSQTGPLNTRVIPATGMPLVVTIGEAERVDMDVESGFHSQESSTSLPATGVPLVVTIGKAERVDMDVESGFDLQESGTSLPATRVPLGAIVDTQGVALEKEWQEQEKLKRVKMRLEKLKADKARQRKNKQLWLKHQEKKAKERQAQLDRLAEAEAAEKIQETGREKSGHGDTASKQHKSGNQMSTISWRKRVINVPIDFYNHTPQIISTNKAMNVTDVCENPSISIIQKQPLWEDDLTQFTSLFYSLFKSPANVPLHIAHPPSSAIHIHIPGEQPIHHTFAKRHILLPNFKNSGLIFNKNGLHTVTKPSRMVMMEDFSIDPANEKRFISMRADTIIDWMDAGPTLQCHQLPMLLPHVEPPSALATDIRAWYHMEGTFPDNNWHFSFAANKGALGTWKVADAGMLLLVIGRPIQNDPDLFADPELYLSNWNSRCESSSWDTEMVLVEKNCAFFTLKSLQEQIDMCLQNLPCMQTYQEQCSSRLPSFAWNGEEIRIRHREKPIEITEMFDITGYTADDIAWLATVA
ncbi:hypothetical protein L208DRAFT_1382534 [Tricholoma matsutake]|nr:hypothetical protein L208DRAFT_1382534 [Tricholoma matsutake 945]